MAIWLSYTKIYKYTLVAVAVQTAVSPCPKRTYPDFGSCVLTRSVGLCNSDFDMLMRSLKRQASGIWNEVCKAQIVIKAQAVRQMGYRSRTIGDYVLLRNTRCDMFPGIPCDR